MRGNFIYKVLLVLCAATVMSSCRENILDDNPKGDYEVFDDVFFQGALRIMVTEEMAALIEAAADTRGNVMKIGVQSSDDILGGIGINYMRRTFRHAGKFEARTRAEGLHLWYDVYFDTKTPLTRAYSDLKSMKGVALVEYRPIPKLPGFNIIPVGAPPAVREDSSLPFNDPQLKQQWHYYNDGTYRGLAGCDVNVVPAWENITTGTPEVIVAVVDGGIDIDHEDLAQNIFINEAEMNGTPGVDDDGNGYIDDIYGYDFVHDAEIIADNHGTHVSGTIAAVNNNGIGVCGIAGGDFAKMQKGVRLLSCQIFADKTGNTAEAIKYGADMGAVISQNSWSYSPSATIPYSDRVAVDYFIKYAGMDENGNQTGPMKGGVVIFAVGNEGKSGACPAAYEPIVAVTSIGADYQKSWFTNYGEFADICAPGGYDEKEHWILSTIAGNGYGIMQGTSMACPHISGIAALIVSEYGGPGFTPEDLMERLTGTADHIIYEGVNEEYVGLLGPGLANAYKALCPEATSEAPATPSGVPVRTHITDAIITVTVPEGSNGQRPYGFNVYYGKTPFQASDITGAALLEGMHKISVRNTADTGERIEIMIPCLEEETKYYIAVQAFDMARNMSGISETVEVTTGFNNPPVLDREIPDIRIPGIGHTVTVNLDRYVYDKDGEALDFVCELTSGNAADIHVEDSVLKAKGLEGGRARARLTVSDHRGKSLETSFDIIVDDVYIDYLCYPNPVTRYMNIKGVSDEIAEIEVQIISAKGNIVYKERHSVSSSSIASVDMADFNSGNYIVSMRDNSGKVTTQEIAKI